MPTLLHTHTHTVNCNLYHKIHYIFPSIHRLGKLHNTFSKLTDKDSHNVNTSYYKHKIESLNWTVTTHPIIIETQHSYYWLHSQPSLLTLGVLFCGSLVSPSLSLSVTEALVFFLRFLFFFFAAGSLIVSPSLLL